MCAESVSDVVHGQRADTLDASDLVFHSSMKHGEVGRLGELPCYCLKPRLHLFEERPRNAPLMGMAFAFAWTPCIGPILGVVLGLAAHNGTLPGGVLLLFAYSLGLAVPFVLVGLAFGRLTTALTRARHWLWAVELVAGLVLVVFGVLLLTDNVSWLSSQLSNLLDHLGLSRLSKS